MLDSLGLEKQVGVMSVQISKVRGGASSRPDCLFLHFRRGRVVRQGSVWGESRQKKGRLFRSVWEDVGSVDS